MNRAARPALGYGFTIGAAAFFAVNGTVSTLALEAGLPATRLTALRCVGAAVGLLLLLLAVSPARLRVTAREVPLLAVFGIVGVALTQFLYYVAIGRMPVGIALVFEMTAPVLIALYVWLVRGEAVRRRLWAALALSLSGLVLVAEVWQDGGSLDPLGVAAGLGAAFCLATYFLLGERGTHTRDPVALTCWSFVAAGLFWSVAAPWWEFDAAVLRERVPLSIGGLELPLWVLVTWIVLMGAIVPFWLSIAALRHLPPTTAGLVATIEPVLASIVAWLWVEQVLSGWQVLGGFVVLTEIALAADRPPGAGAHAADRDRHRHLTPGAGQRFWRRLPPCQSSCRPTSPARTPKAGSCGRSRRLRFISAKPGKLARPITWSHSSAACSSSGSRLMTGPKKATPCGGRKCRIGVPTSLPVRASASSVSARITSSRCSSSSASARSPGRPAAVRIGATKSAVPCSARLASGPRSKTCSPQAR